jgi:hypothetical protein
LLPAWVAEYAIARRQRAGRAAMIYVHPWELDPTQPYLPLPMWSQWRHRVNLSKTEEKLWRLLRAHRFTTASRVLEQFNHVTLPEYRLEQSVARTAASWTSNQATR